MTDQLRIVAPFHNISGYAHAGRALLRAALLAGYTVEAVECETDGLISRLVESPWVRRGEVPRFLGRPIPACQKEEIDVCSATQVPYDAPTLILHDPKGIASVDFCSGPRIGITMLETDTLHPLWASSARNVDALAAPSEFCRAALERACPGLEISTLPLPVDERVWSTDGPILPILDRPEFLFLCVCATTERKHWRMLLQGFAEEFRGEEVGLLIKPTRYAEVEELAAWCRDMGAWVEVIPEEMYPDEKMASLYRAADCFVLPSCEGFGMPFVEAALCGLPSVALSLGGQADIVTEETGYVVPSRMEPSVGLLPHMYPSDYRWSTCRIEDLKATLRRAREGARGEGPGASKGAAARQRALEQWTPRALAGPLHSLIENGIREFKISSNGGKTLTGFTGLTRLGMGTEFSVSNAEGEQPESYPENPVHPVKTAFPPLTCVVTSYNALEKTKRCVAALTLHTPCARIVLADSSLDGTREWARLEGIALVECEPGSIPASRNRALELVKAQARPGEWLAFLENDVEVGPGWWEGLYEVMEANPRIGILSAKKVLPDGSLQNIGLRLRPDGNSFPVSLERAVVHCDYVEPGCMIVRPEVWRSCTWDEQFPMWYEDCDYSFQCRQLGYNVCATASVVVIHDAHTTSSARVGEIDGRRRQFLQKWKGRV
jgi:GT2 family glycosyltransferase/glycosyltransferase involved in cell wall biosynthesis